ncbi:MAG: pyruvate kinase, partial [Chloroflexi bacterium]|nr:pyruvate kinase [Chloroflexota bacterium]
LKRKEVQLKEGADFTLTTATVPGDEHSVSVNLPELAENVKRGDVIFLDDGAIKLEVVRTTHEAVRCRVIVGGILGWEKGVNVPGVNLKIPSCTEKDFHDLLFGIEHEVDFVALSFVREAKDMLRVRKFLKKREADIPIIAKIEKWEAWENLEKILAASDGLMVARGDLGVEIPLERVPLAQKEIIRRCNHAGKPVITATQMLESMMESPHPTRAEVTDIANSIFDGTDAIMLSGETAVGRYPVEAVQVMMKIALITEAALPYSKMLLDKGADLEPQTDDAISYAACHTAHQLGAAAIVAFTSSGSTARRVSKYRPGIPILAATPSPKQRRRLLLSWGVYPFEVAEPSDVADLLAQGARLSLETGVARKGDLIVITAGIPIGIAGTTNLLKVERVE